MISCELCKISKNTFLTKQYHQNNIPTVMTFIDFKKAFDSINRDTMWKILRHYGLPEKIGNIIRCLYDGSTSAVGIDGILSQELLITIGVLQGDALAPFYSSWFWNMYYRTQKQQ